MSLRHAILTALLDGDASGYELAKHFDLSVANFWHALPAQLYPELARLDAEGLAQSTDVAQDRRPNKRVYAITDAGRAELRQWVAKPSKPMSVKDELVLRVRSGADSDPEAIAEALQHRRHVSVAKLDGYRAMQKQMLRGRNEEEFLRSARRIGPYLTLLGGIALEQEHLQWIDHVQAALDSRRQARHAPTPA
jgi:DNA-binding PadR family transcriptional regulator